MVDKNLLLVKAIERFPCLYNSNSVDYSRKEVTDVAWNEIADETKLTVTECKEKWKNLRYGFIRSLRPNRDGSAKKKYYLHYEMEFVLPFIKLIPKSNGYAQQQYECGSDDEIIENTESRQSPHFFDIDMFQSSEPPKKRLKVNDSSKYMQNETYAKVEEPRKLFLLSLLPEINELTEKQMKLFRRQILSLLDSIAETSAEYTADNNYHIENTIKKECL
ncbi:hypothetical protein ACJJTC_017296 [Scirpophaga incertulas]